MKSNKIYSQEMNFSCIKRGHLCQSSLKINRYHQTPQGLTHSSTNPQTKRCNRWAGNELSRIFYQGIWITRGSLNMTCVIPWTVVAWIGAIILRICLLRGIANSRSGIFKIIPEWISRMLIMQRRRIRGKGLLIIGKIKLYRIFYQLLISAKGKKCMRCKWKHKIKW